MAGEIIPFGCSSRNAKKMPQNQPHVVSNRFAQYPTSQATVPDIENYLLDVEESTGKKLKAVVIDYINILSNYRNPNSENTYMKIKQIAEDLRGMADRNNWLIVTATQIKRSGYDASDISMDDIAESAGLSHTADMIYGMGIL